MSTTWSTIKKIGAGWEYNEIGYTYNQSLDPVTGALVTYNTSGTATVWTEINKP